MYKISRDTKATVESGLEVWGIAYESLSNSEV